MIPAAFKYQGRFPSAALVVPSGFSLYGNCGGEDSGTGCIRQQP